MVIGQFRNKLDALDYFRVEEEEECHKRKNWETAPTGDEGDLKAKLVVPH